ncbi:Gfo/Idh/MocA family protein [Caminibacter mediatlanticus]|uniref:Predicted dehydrogenase n=1 Tax=Caminibacter mediatlanticus TB-2 TaxID=391592 RepID=A0AAI9AGM9_9BACT|nr:Gfo/Idh/MocA family oxidoreductase [Caminibacter mediatlanticus]EDM23159.1 Predicted dehydrogenase [Caminibacter mediatlanticus TB-2]
MKVLLIGTGYMSKEYVKVLKGLNVNFVVVGNSYEKSKQFKEETGIVPFIGGIEKFMENNKINDYFIINAVSTEKLYQITIKLLENNAKNILIEKPGGLFKKEIENLYNLSEEKKAHLYIAYNRRFYASTLKAKEIIESVGKVTSFNFEFTEWSHIIEKLNKPLKVLNKWFLANSTHVADLAFYLGGFPKEISCFTSGSLDWHPSASIFTGSGVSENDALFSYFANWESAGRWSIEVLTNEFKLIFKPLEELKIQKKGSVKEENIVLDNELDVKFKPGLYKQVEAFFNNSKELCTISQQLKNFKIYELIANYGFN